MNENIVINQGEVIHGFNSLDGITGTNCNLALSTSVLQEGTAAVSALLTSDSNANIRVSLAQELSNTTLLSFYVHINDIDFYSSSVPLEVRATYNDWVSYIYIQIPKSKLKSGWNYFKYRLTDFTKVGTVNYPQEFSMFEFIFARTAGQPLQLHFDNMMIDFLNKSYVMLCFEPHVSNKGSIWSYIESKGYKTIFGYHSGLLGGDWLENDDFLQLQTDGHDVLNGSHTDTPLTGYTADAVKLRLSTTKAAMDGAGLSDNSNNVLLPGMGNNDTITNVLIQDYNFGIGGADKIQHLPYEQKQSLSCFFIPGNTTDNAAVDAAITALNKVGGLLVIYIRETSAAPTQAQQFDELVFRYLLDYLSSTNIEVLNLTEFNELYNATATLPATDDITKIRTIINEKVESESNFTNQEIQDILDEYDNNINLTLSEIYLRKAAMVDESGISSYSIGNESYNITSAELYKKYMELSKYYKTLDNNSKYANIFKVKQEEHTDETAEENNFDTVMGGKYSSEFYNY